ncbi:MAG: flagellar export chaperone FliS [Bacillus sp. (in: firmicutes)]
MAANNPYKAYQQNSVTTASPGELTIMLYNGCLKFIGKAKQAMKAGNIEERNSNIQRAQDIVREFMVTLDMGYEVSGNMMVLYEYCSSKLTEANIRNDQAALEEAEMVITEFRDTWKQVIQLNRKKQHQGDVV